MGEDEKNRGVSSSGEQQQQQHYGTFQGVAVGLPQPAPPPGSFEPSAIPPPPPPPPYYAQGYQAVPGYAVAEGRPVRESRLPCCGCGIGWFLFIIGFFLAAVPWYIGAFLLLCTRVDYREKPGFIVCTVAAVLATIAIIFGVTKGADDW
ncbi:hypothetical protein RJ641_034247 [Dillenia turbinata]|uniref:60S ribosomal protein L18a-like protein n=1 Tax=Dillenia turbinata TaxID=194707 RepID=A0AAN8VVB8_9MAGN